MKIFGYRNEDLDQVEPRPLELAEITLAADPGELRKIAKFLSACADGIEARGEDWNHEHLSDKITEFKDSPQFIVFNPKAAE